MLQNISSFYRAVKSCILQFLPRLCPFITGPGSNELRCTPNETSFIPLFNDIRYTALLCVRRGMTFFNIQHSTGNLSKFARRLWKGRASTFGETKCAWTLNHFFITDTRITCYKTFEGKWSRPANNLCSWLFLKWPDPFLFVIYGLCDLRNLRS